MNKNEPHKPIVTGRTVVTAVIALTFLCGLLIPSPVFYLAERMGGSRIFLAKDTTEMIMPDGSVYEGTVNAFNGKFDGYGVLKTAHAGYTGKWINGRLILGKLTTPQMTYEGGFGGGLDIDGFGIARYSRQYIDSLRAAGLPDSSIIIAYTGNFSRSIRNGLGRAVMADSTMVFGRFSNGNPVKTPNAAFRLGETVYGIDISHFQKNLDWDNLALFCDRLGTIHHDTPTDSLYMQPVLFVYIKATEGSAFKDSAFAANMRAARRHGITRGAYHFLRLKGDVEDHISNFTGTAIWRPGDLPPVLDVEVESEILAYGVEKSLDFIYRWLKGVEAETGIKPMIYTTDKIRDLYLDTDARFKEFDYWMARYNRIMPPENSDWKFWQFSDKGALNGSDSPADLDVYNSDLNSFNRYLQELADTLRRLDKFNK